MNLNLLRDSFDLSEEVHVQFRGYNGGSPQVRLGTIVGKESAFAKVKFDKTTQMIPYTRLLRARPPSDIKPKPELPPRVVAPAPAPAEVPAGKVERTLRAVPSAFAGLEAPAKPELPEPENNQVVEPVHTERLAHEAMPALLRSEVPDDVAAWIDMGESLLPTLKATEKRLRNEAQDLADQAEKLMETSDAKIKEAEGVAKHIRLFERLHE